MKVKRYVADDLPGVVQQIRGELGPDAVILGTKEIREGGFLGMFRKRRVEVIAAVDEASLTRARAAARSLAMHRQALAERPDGLQTSAAAGPADASAVTGIATLMPSQAVRERYANQHQPSPASASVSTPASSQALFPDARTEPAASGPASGFRPAAAGEAEPVSGGDRDELMRELRAVKEMVLRMARQQTLNTLPEPAARWSRRLADQGVEASLVERFAEELQNRLEADRKDPAEAAREILLEWLEPFTGKGITADTRIVRLVGPTGVGKTTTLAKLAAEQTLTYRRSVGFITADTYRIAAVDQLRTYANILNVPMEVVFSPAELHKAFHKLADRDLLLMDTAGRNYRNELFVSEVNALLSPGENAQTYLVLSMTHKYSDMKTVASHFVKYGVDGLLLTKLDETDSYGAVLNLVQDFGLSISYITCGQTVPDDIRVFDPEDLVRRLLGE
ncbi:MAG: flagellar biosynthesis protein FlhF [Paenibacillaceae bacterium ZCTH02-B3]|nr:MAG: flagellar biosynthesis protein FlhF [Paenibacillaceae bacterium ZCTH02-B3]